MGFFGIRFPDGMDLTGHFFPAAGADRYEQGTVYWPAYYGMRESLRWLEEDVGWPWIYERTAAITERCRAMLGELPGVTVHSPAIQGPLTAFSLAGHEAMAAATWLADQGIRIRSVPHYNWLRVATGFFTSDADLDRLREGLTALSESQSPA
jgi:selenocysteine lyase/cysteine desulfurase